MHVNLNIRSTSSSFRAIFYNKHGVLIRHLIKWRIYFSAYPFLNVPTPTFLIIDPETWSKAIYNQVQSIGFKGLCKGSSVPTSCSFYSWHATQEHWQSSHGNIIRIAMIALLIALFLISLEIVVIQGLVLLSMFFWTRFDCIGYISIRILY